LSLFYLERAEKGGFVFVSGPVLDANRKKWNALVVWEGVPSGLGVWSGVVVKALRY
jgi:hypothetical protein